MILNNYWEWQRQKEWGQVDWSGQVEHMIRPTTNLVTENNGIITNAIFKWQAGYCGWPDYYRYLYQNYMLNSNWGFRISDSTDEVTPDAYTLSGLTYTDNSITLNIQNVDGTLKQIVTCSGRNNSGSDYTIRKVGIAKKFQCLAGSTVALSDFVYLFIVELEEPITVQNGKGFTISIDLTEQ